MTTQKKYEKAKELIASGIPTRDAVKKAGIAYSTYWYKHKGLSSLKSPRKKKSSPQLIQLPVTPSRLIALVGTPDEVLSAIRGLS